MLQISLLLFLSLVTPGIALKSDSLLLSLTQFVLQQNGNRTTMITPCVEQLQQLHNAWQDRQSWALKAFDASGSGYDDFMLGNSFWLGNRQTCQAVNKHLLQDFTRQQQELLNQTSPFAFDYRLVYLRANSPWQLALSVKETPLLHISLCVPRSCGSKQFEKLLREVLSKEVEFLQIRAELVYTKQPKLSNEFFASKAFRLLVGLLAVMLLLTLLAFCRCTASNPFVCCFNLSSNWQRLWHLPSNTQEIAVMNGLRVCCAFALLGFHVVWYQFYSINHSVDLASKLVKICLHHAYLPGMLEVFFVISGFLTVNNFLRNEYLQRCIAADTLSGNMRRFQHQLTQRYLRLAPLQFLVVLLSVVSFAYHREVSVFHLIEPVDLLCTQHWWRNLLFIQNLYPIKEMCCNWTWSLGCDLQLHIGAMLLLYLHTRYARMVRRLVVLLLLGNIIYTVLVLVVLDVSPTFDIMYGAGDWLYTKPAVRMLSYIIGSIYGYAHANGKGSPFDTVFPSKLAKGVLAGVALFLGWAMKPTTTKELASPGVLGCAMVLLRSLISAGSAHLIFCSFRIRQSARPIRCLVYFLESKCFQRINRVIYAFYLLNPLIILNFYYSFSNAIPSDASILVILCVAHLFIVLVCSIALTLFFELPFNRLSNLLLSIITSKSKII